MDWSAAARTWRAAAVRVREPYNVLPSTAIARLEPDAAGGMRAASHVPIVDPVVHVELGGELLGSSLGEPVFPCGPRAEVEHCAAGGDG